jgi:anti-sigma-K factor RskA
MSTTPSQPDAPDTDELVAYLDGELSAEDARRVERRLANDADYRRRLTDLEQAWSALEALPQKPASENFARTTIEMVAVAAERDVASEQIELQASGQRQRWIALAAGLAIAVAAFAAARTFVPSRNDALVASLPVVAQLDVLTQVGDIEYLEGLTKLEVSADPRHEEAAQAWSTVNELKSPTARREWIETLTPEKKTELAARFERFERLQPAEKERLFELNRAIDESPDHKLLDATLTTYASWIQSRTQGEQVELRDRDLSTKERLKMAKRLIEQSNRVARRQLSMEDERALQEAILEIVEQRRPEFLSNLRAEGNPNPEGRIESQSASQVALGIIGHGLFRERNDDRRRKLQDQLVSRLSPEAQDYFDELDGWRRSRQLWQWTFAALEPSLRPQSLEEFFTEKLTSDQREYLLGLPYSEMEEQLQQMYMASQVGFRNEDFDPRTFWRGRGPDDRERGPDRDRGPGGRRDGRRGEFGERGPFPGPGGMNGPPPGGRPGGRPPRDGRGWGPPPDGGPPRGEFGPPRDGIGPPPGPPPQGPQPEERERESDEPI